MDRIQCTLNRSVRGRKYNTSCLTPRPSRLSRQNSCTERGLGHRSAPIQSVFGTRHALGPKLYSSNRDRLACWYLLKFVGWPSFGVLGIGSHTRQIPQQTIWPPSSQRVNTLQASTTFTLFIMQRIRCLLPPLNPQSPPAAWDGRILPPRAGRNLICPRQTKATVIRMARGAVCGRGGAEYAQDFLSIRIASEWTSDAGQHDHDHDPDACRVCGRRRLFCLSG
ncbi:hypothetical protein R3P38DRAFT_1096483 [Favolaschia claudopus]|uniref:Uncharacterized protein n=1 Tax=Favolaschia claudopus TaxID=2862362 RepID=A0AAW0BCU8_9AGAR